MRAAAVIAVAGALLAGCGDDGAETTAADSPPAFDEVAGEWSGTLRQAATEPFPIEVTIESEDDERLNVVRYGGEIGCSGNWGFVGEAGSQLLFREVIDRGRGGRCKGVGTVRLTPTGAADRLDYEFRGGGVESEGVLSRDG